LINQQKKTHWAQCLKQYLAFFRSKFINMRLLEYVPTGQLARQDILPGFSTSGLAQAVHVVAEEQAVQLLCAHTKHLPDSKALPFELPELQYACISA
jgi:hypothetical protein